MTRDEIALRLFVGMLGNGVMGPGVSKIVHREWIGKCFEYADIFDCCKEKTLDEIKLMLHVMLPDEIEVETNRAPCPGPPPNTGIAPLTAGGSGGSSSSPNPFGGVGGLPMLKTELFNMLGFSQPGEDDCSGGVIIQP